MWVKTITWRKKDHLQSEFIQHFTVPNLRGGVSQICVKFFLPISFNTNFSNLKYMEKCKNYQFPTIVPMKTMLTTILFTQHKSQYP